MSYRHLSPGERECIEVLLKCEASCVEIGKVLGRSHSTISREVSRNRGKRGYRHQQAQRRTEERHAQKAKSIKLTDEMKKRIQSGLRKDWSPEQIAGRLEQQGEPTIHRETIYRYILADKQDAGKLYKKLRHQKTYRKRYGSPGNRTGIPDRVDISKRPKIVEKRKRVGDWEGDTIIGREHKGAIVTLDERKTKLRVAAPLSRKLASATAEWIIELLGKIKEFVKTITFDNGKEFASHKEVAKSLDCDTFFATPYHSWERGQNENANGLLRQYFPKKMKLNHVSPRKVFAAVDKLNSRPRKCLGFTTPYEAFEKATGVNVRKLLRRALMMRI